MHYTVTWGGDPEDVTITTSGVVVVHELDAMMKDVVADPRWGGDGTKVLLDHTQTDWSAVGSRDLDVRAGLVEAIAHEIGAAQVAFVVTGQLNVEIGKTLGARISGVAFTAKAFTSLDEAREWLRHEPDLDDVDVRPG
jgi:hypothetical protein